MSHLSWKDGGDSEFKKSHSFIYRYDESIQVKFVFKTCY